MSDHHIYPGEALLLLAWLAAPAWIVMAVLLLSVPLPSLGYKGRLSAIVLTAILSIPITLLLWISLPKSLLPGSVLPETWPTFPPFFFPAYLATILVGLPITGVFCRAVSSRRLAPSQ